jgi:hypothetical protein
VTSSPNREKTGGVRSRDGDDRVGLLARSSGNMIVDCFKLLLKRALTGVINAYPFRRNDVQEVQVSCPFVLFALIQASLGKSWLIQPSVSRGSRSVS